MEVANAFQQDIVKQLRLNVEPSVEVASGLNHIEPMAYLRRIIREEDISRLLDLSAQRSDARAAFYLGLLAAHSAHHLVQSTLRARWEQATPYVRTHLVWRLADDPSLPASWHDILQNHVFTEWDLFQRESVKYLGPEPSLILSRAMERYTDYRTSDSKRWLYLCSAAGTKQYENTLKFLLSHARFSLDARRRVVAEKVLTQLGII